MLSELDVGRILKSFDKIDNDRSGQIELAELLAFLDLEKTTFTRRVFSMFDEDSSGLVDFRELVVTLWNYCSLGKTSLPLFTFDLYDTDSSGELGEEELVKMVEHMYGKEHSTNLHARQLMEDVAGMSTIGISEFSEFARTHPALLFKAFQMQESIRNRILGKFFWEQFSIRRLKISKGLYVPISNFLSIHMSKDAVERMMDMPVLPSSPKAHGSSKLTVTKNFKIALSNSGTHGRRAAKFRAAEDPSTSISSGRNAPTSTSISISSSSSPPQNKVVPAIPAPASMRTSANAASTAASEGSGSAHLQSHRGTASASTSAPAPAPPSTSAAAAASAAAASAAASARLSTKPDLASSRRRASVTATSAGIVGRRRSTIAPDASSLKQSTALPDALEAPSLERNVHEMLASKARANAARRRSFER